MGKHKLLLCIAVIFGQATATEKKHYWPWGPLLKSEALPLIKFEPLKWLEIIRDERTGLLEKGRAVAREGDTQLILTRNKAGFVAQVQNSESILMHPRLCSAFYPFYHEMHYYGHINEDKQPDFLLQFYCGGTGLNANFNEITFLLSNESGYEATSIKTFGGAPGNQFVKIDGKPHFIHEAFGGEDECIDGKPHNFWIYNLFEIKGDKLYLANQNHPNFPKTVWYTFKPNSKETDLLSKKDKQNLLIRSVQDLKLIGNTVTHCPETNEKN